MRIAHICQPLPVPPITYGGTEKVVFELAKEQAQSGHDVTVFAGPGSSVPGAECIWFSSSSIRYRGWTAWKIYTATHVKRSLRMASEHFDLIHNHVAEEGIALSPLARAPVLTTLHGAAPSNLWRRIITALSAVPNKSKLVAISRSHYAAHTPYFGGDLLGYVYNGIDVERCPFVKTPKHSSELSLCFVGRFIPEKGAHLAIRVVRALRHLGIDARLRLCGPRENPASAYYRQTIAIAGEENGVTLEFNLPEPELFGVIANSDAMIFPVEWEEPFGLAVIESLACGTPVLASRRGALPELIEDGVTGFLCDTMSDFIGFSGEVTNLTRGACRTHVANRFTTKIMRERYEHLYEQVMATAL